MIKASSLIVVMVMFLLGCSCEETAKISPENRGLKTQQVRSKITPHVPQLLKTWEVHERSTHFFFIGLYLWLLDRDQVRIVGPGKFKGPDSYIGDGATEVVQYNNLIKDPQVATATKLFEFWREMLSDDWSRSKYLRLHEKDAFQYFQDPIEFGLANRRRTAFLSFSDEVYFFSQRGDFLEKRKERDPWWWIKDGIYGNSDWRVEIDKLFYKNREIKVDHGKAFSGHVVVALSIDSVPKDRIRTKNKNIPERIELTFLDRRTGEVKKTLQNIEIGANSALRLREYGEGFYLDKKVEYKKHYFASDYRPMIWVGKEVIDLQSDREEFCYVYVQTKRCIPNPDNLILEVVEADYALYVFTYDKVYVKRKDPECMDG